MLSTPGHTRGHQSLMVHLDSGQTVILLADAAYLLAKMRERALPGVIWSPDAMVSSWERIESLEREHDAMLIATHELDFREQRQARLRGVVRVTAPRGALDPLPADLVNRRGELDSACPRTPR